MASLRLTGRAAGALTGVLTARAAGIMGATGATGAALEVERAGGVRAAGAAVAPLRRCCWSQVKSSGEA